MTFLDLEGLKYFKDKENEQIAPVEELATASQAYAVGEYFWYEGNFCKAKTPIAQGDEFVQNTNFTVDKMGKDLYEVKSNFDSLGLSVIDGKINITYTI